MQLAVQRLDRCGVVVFSRLHDAAAPEHVVDCDQTTLAQQYQATLVISVVTDLVGVDESKVKPAALALCDQRVECFKRGSDMQADLVGDPGFFPIVSCD